jgi:putative glutathione S-transferase
VIRAATQSRAQLAAETDDGGRFVRFDAVYFSHFKCNLRRITDHAALWPYIRELYGWPGIADTVDFDHIKRHYHVTHDSINPTGIVPKGPELDLTKPHDRG